MKATAINKRPSRESSRVGDYGVPETVKWAQAMAHDTTMFLPGIPGGWVWSGHGQQLHQSIFAFLSHIKGFFWNETGWATLRIKVDTGGKTAHQHVYVTPQLPGVVIMSVAVSLHHEYYHL